MKQHTHESPSEGGRLRPAQSLIGVIPVNPPAARPGGGGGGGVTDHGALSGLSDDDHPQYATNTEFDAHASRHQAGGADEIDVTGLVGAGGGSGTLTTVKDEGSNLSTAVVSLDFVGAGVTATGTTAVTVTIPGGSAPTSNILVDIATPIKRTGGNITCNQTSWGELAAETGGPGTGGFDLDMAGLQAGDIVEVCISGLAASAATYLYLDIATIVSGSPVNYFGGVTGASTGDGVMCWTAVTGREDPFGGCVSYVVQSGDLTAGAIKLRPWMRTSSATNRTLFGAAADPLHISARAYRP